MCFGCIHDRIGSQFDQLQNEIVWMLCFDFILLKNFSRKVPQIHRDNNLCLPFDSYSKYMAVIFIWQAQAWDQVFIVLDKGIACSLVHELACALQLFPREIRSVVKKVGNLLLVRIVRPLGAEDAGERQMHQKVSQLGRIQNVRVIKRNKRSHP